MKNINRIVSIFFVFIFITFSSHSEIKDALFATVGDKAITESDVVNEIKIILILSGKPYSEDQRDQLQSIAVKESVKRNIKKIEIEKYQNLSFNKKDLEIELINLATNLNIDVDTLKNRFFTNGINFEIIIENLKTELLWNSLIFHLYKDRLNINLDEINEELASYDETKTIDEYLISEIIIEHTPNSDLDSEIKKIKEKINNEGFEKVAMDLSISETAVNGGDLGWININTITDKFKSKIVNTPMGKVSEAVVLPEGILFFEVRNKRALQKNLNLEDARKQLVAAEKSKMLNMFSLSHYDTLRRSIAINYY